MMRPLVVVSALRTRGAERVTVSFLLRLAQQGMRVPVCTVTARHDGPLAAELAEAGVERLDLDARRLADPAALGRLVSLLQRRRFDLVHAHGQDASILCAAARMIHRTPLAITRHVLAEPASSWSETARARTTLAAFHRADARVAVSDAAADRLAALARLPRRTIRVIRNGIDVDRVGAPAREQGGDRVRGALGLGGADRVVLLPAALRAGKGHATLLAALPALLERVPHARVLLAGDGERAAELRRRAERFGDAVRFLGERDDVPLLLAACDLVVLPSRAEALPTALIEAAAAGRPVVATRVGGTPEVVDHGRTGLLVPPDDPTALADAVAGLLLDPERARAFGRAARARARRRFDLGRQARETLALWDRLAIGGSG